MGKGGSKKNDGIIAKKSELVSTEVPEEKEGEENVEDENPAGEQHIEEPSEITEGKQSDDVPATTDNKSESNDPVYEPQPVHETTEVIAVTTALPDSPPKRKRKSRKKKEEPKSEYNQEREQMLLLIDKLNARIEALEKSDTGDLRAEVQKLRKAEKELQEARVADAERYNKLSVSAEEEDDSPSPPPVKKQREAAFIHDDYQPFGRAFEQSDRGTFGYSRFGYI